MALAYLRELTGGTPAAVLAPDGRLLAGSVAVAEAAAAQAAAAEELCLAIGAETLLAVRGAVHVVATLAGPGALKQLVLHDLRSTLERLEPAGAAVA
jgi:hypothetical protein